MNRTIDFVENLVIGGGPAGSMVALRLARAGRAVTLLERELAPQHKVCGEFLSQEAVEYLNQVGVAPLALGAAVIRKVRIFSGRQSVEAELPFRALSLSRRMMDESLLRRAEEEGCAVRRGACVEKLLKCDDDWEALLRDGTRLRARTVFMANGKHDLNGWARGHGSQSELVGFKLHWRLSRQSVTALREVMNLFLFLGGYGGLSLIENDMANLCLVVDRTRLRALGGWPALLDAIVSENELLKGLLGGATALCERPLAISPIPYGYLARESNGLWRVGDQAAVIPSFTGDGISIALHSSALAARMYLDDKTAAEFHQTLYAQLHRRMHLAAWLSRALVTSMGRGFAATGLLLIPRALQWVASATRIPEAALATGRENSCEPATPDRVQMH